ncbi:MAG: hypothetical protein AAF752_05440 [Bacteroidota bacterium]
MSDRVTSAALGGLVMAIIGTTLGIFALQSQIVGFFACCIPGLVGGLLAVWHYTNAKQATLLAGPAAGLGALTGVFAFAFGIVLGYAVAFAGLAPAPFDVEAGMELAREQMLKSNPEMSDDQIDSALELSRSFVQFGWIISLVASVLMGAIGAVIGANVFKKGPAESTSEWD